MNGAVGVRKSLYSLFGEYAARLRQLDLAVGTVKQPDTDAFFQFPNLFAEGRLSNVHTQCRTTEVQFFSDGFWKRKFGSSPEALGKALTLHGAAHTIVGVIPANFYYSGSNFQRSDVYVPIGQWNDATFRDRRTGMGMDAVGRIKPGVTFEYANADMQAVAQHLAEKYPEADQGSGITLVPLKQDAHHLSPRHRVTRKESL